VKVKKQRFAFGIAPFFDAGTVRDNWQDLNFKNIKTSYGGGLRIAWNQSTILSFDYGHFKRRQTFLLWHWTSILI
jgi:outer membrane protein assembly factor BamA